MNDQNTEDSHPSDGWLDCVDELADLLYAGIPLDSWSDARAAAQIAYDNGWRQYE